jgi:hypothetical protein
MKTKKKTKAITEAPKSPTKAWSADAEICHFMEPATVQWRTSDGANVEAAFQPLITAILTLPRSFSRTSALRKLMEAREAVIRAASMKFVTDPVTGAGSKNLP